MSNQTRLFLLFLLLTPLCCLPMQQTPDGGDGNTWTWDTTNTTDTSSDTGNQEEGYRYVMLVDRQELAAAELEEAPGIDVDALQLSSGGLSYWASDIAAAEPGAATVDAKFADFTRLLRGAEGTCNLNDVDFVSMGGAPAFAIVSFDNRLLKEGDEVTVHECAFGLDASVEPYDIFIGVSNDPSDQRWVPCAIDAVGAFTCTVPVLPDPNVQSAFYGSCAFSDRVSTQFNGSATRPEAETRCADVTNPSGIAGVLGETGCDTSGLLGACATTSPPPTNQEALYFYAPFAEPATYCSETLGQVWTEGSELTGPTGPFIYVRIVDAGEPGAASASGTAGADIDGLQLSQDGRILYATAVQSMQQGSGEVSEAASVSDAVFGAPQNDCSPQAPTFLSLGGEGGEVVVSFGSLQPLSEGDLLTVFECGKDQQATSTDDLYDVWVGTEADPNSGTWSRCVTAGTGIESCLVPPLPTANAAPFFGSCTFASSCAQFEGELARSAAVEYCAGANPISELGTLSEFDCSQDGVVGTCAVEGHTEMIYSGQAGNTAQQYCEIDLAGLWTPAPPSRLPYRSIKIVDLDPNGVSSPNGTAGVDIDAASVDKNGLVYYATTSGLVLGTGAVGAAMQDATNAEGAPQHGCDAAQPDFVSLGGAPGTLVLTFGTAEILEGNSITVYECGAEQTPGAPDEFYQIFVGTSEDPSDPNWVECSASAKGIGKCTVPNLPVVMRH